MKELTVGVRLAEECKRSGIENENDSIIKEIKVITEINTRRFPRKNVTMWRNKSARKCPKSSVLQRRWSLVIIIIIIIIITIPHRKNSNSILTAPSRTTWA